jgi:AraC-like DNA-binding protein
VLPDPSVNLVFMCRRDEEGRVDAPRLALIGPILRPYPLALRPAHEIVAVKLHPEWSRPLLGAQAREHADRIDDLHEVNDAAGPLLDKLACTRHWSEASRLLTGFIQTTQSRMATSAGRQARQHEAAMALRRAPLRHSVSAAAADCGVGPRHFRRLFEVATGITPKSYSRIRRLLQLLATADAVQRPDWATLALAGGYSDQSHMVNEFRDITGLTPTALLRERRLEAGLYRSRA